MTQDLTFPQLTAVAPNYEKSAFEVQFDHGDLAINLQFKNYLIWTMGKDEKLLEYLANHFIGKSYAEMVQDLYEIGIPVDDQVEQYFGEIQNAIAPKLLKLMEYLKNIGEDPQDLE